LALCSKAYVYEFEDKSLLLIITEHTKIEPKNIEDYREFVWAPRIESINRPVHYVNLQGVITTVHSNSGLVKRCNNCKSILYDSCPNNCKEGQGWSWDLRVSCRLYDSSGSIKMILTKDLASRILQRNLSELILLANGSAYPGAKSQSQFQTSVCKIRIPNTVGDMFDKDKAKKSHYHHRYVCCVGSRSKNYSSSVEERRWQDN